MSKGARGFAAMSLKKRKEVASRGGRAAQQRGVGHRWTAEEATAQGVVGGAALVQKYGNNYMREIGSRGGNKKYSKKQPN